MSVDYRDDVRAIALAGYKVVPQARKMGQPHPPGWQTIATSDPEKAAALFDEWKGYVPGILCGPRGGITVIDIDVAEGKSGKESLAKLEEELGSLGKPVAQSGSGGLHYYFRHTPDVVAVTNLIGRIGDDVDIMGVGSILHAFVYAPPARREKDTHTGPYKWLTKDGLPPPVDGLPYLSEAWIKAIQKAGHREGGSAIHPQSAELVKIEQGIQNDILYRAGLYLRQRGAERDEIDEYLSKLSRENCDPPHPRHRLRSIVKSLVHNVVPDPKKLLTHEGRDALQEESSDHNYRMDPARGIWWIKWKPQKEGPPIPEEVQLANFQCRVVMDMEIDDGVEIRRETELEASVNHRQPRLFVVSSDEFPECKWATRELGHGAIIEPGSGIKDRLRHAIQSMSPDPPNVQIYAHTGWRKIDDQYVYLHADGAIGPNGKIDSILVRLTGGLERYKLPAPPTGEKLVEVTQKALALLDLAPKHIMVPLLGATWSACLDEFAPMNMTLYLEGPTGVFKTELAALVQGFYGKWDAQQLPANFTSTSNALEKLASDAKDTLFVIDDYAPASSKRSAIQQQNTADRLLRNAGNRAGRQRMTANTSIRPTYEPRGFCLITGEQLPDGHSLMARSHIVRLSTDDRPYIDLATLTAAQRDRDQGVFAEAMAGYVQWLSNNPKLCIGFKQRRTDFRKKIIDDWDTTGSHSRTPHNVATLSCGFRLFLKYAIEIGAITIEDATRRWEQAELVFRGALSDSEPGQTQASFLQHENPVHRFFELLTAALVSGKAHVLPLNPTLHSPSKHRESLGWKRDVSGSNWYASGDNVGWVDLDADPYDPDRPEQSWGDIYLIPQAAIAAVHEMARKQGESWTMKAVSLWRMMREDRRIKDAESGRHSCRITVGEDKERKRVIWLRASDIIGEVDPYGADHSVVGDDDLPF